ncbi:hypothetical protein A1O1_08832 [Capronia coronata CBS 617.96]|uniref:Glutamyl-tRNA amidotransferase complex subunit Gta3 domain-containing protein n=1 Tax=Capronia coronata CBS 617.96 TaxID=1182541 RepID=W9XD86_9EURO|nr:uncharacterized protein A1O1_08832 [Capronia coronata CBS 617.96]EXJ78432.1 hypothetical protein A1O1_08832 [Capronia coronata CBS 617.96]
MPRITRGPLTIRTELSGPGASPERDKLLRLVKSIEINPKIASLLKKPTWSVASLMPPTSTSTSPSTQPSTSTSENVNPGLSAKKDSNVKPKTKEKTEDSSDAESEVTPSKLQHLLRLSALPPPKSAQEQTEMLRTLQQQLHFVKEIQKVDTTGVTPLVALRDETQEARQERGFTLDSLQEYLRMEEKVGVNGTIRRRKMPVDWSKEFSSRLNPNPEKGVPDRQDDRVLAPFEMGEGDASRKRGQFFFVKRSKKDEGLTQGEG